MEGAAKFLMSGISQLRFEMGHFSLILNFDLFDSTIDTIFTVFHYQVTFRNSLGKGSRIVNGTEICWLDAQTFRLGTLPKGAPGALDEI